MKKKIDSLSAGKPATANQPVVEEVKAHAETPAPEPAPAKVEEPAKTEAATPPATEATPAPPAATTPAPEPDSFEALFPEPSSAAGAPPSWLWWVILLIVSVVLGVVGYALAQKNLRQWLSLAPTPSPTISASASPLATATATPTATPDATATPTPTPTPSGATDVSKVTLRVLNGTTTGGAANKAKTTLEAAGYTVRTTGNAKSQNYATTTVYYQTGHLADAQAVQAVLKNYTVTLTESSLADPDMILVVIGKK